MFEALYSLWDAVRYLKVAYPLLLIVAAAGAWRLPRRRGRRLLLGCVAALFAMSWFPVSWANHYLLERPYREASTAPPVDAIVVLSGAASAPSDEFPYGLLMESTIRRTRQAAHQASRRPRTPVMACGPHFPNAPQAPSVAAEMAELLAGWGVERERIWLEENGRSTAAQSAEAAGLLRARGVRSVLLVTDAFHMRRAAGCFRKLGFKVHAAPSHIHSQPPTPVWTDLLPSPSVVIRNEEALREWLALAVYQVRGVI